MRVRLIELTPAGRKLVEESIDARQRWMLRLETVLPEKAMAAAVVTLEQLTQAAGKLELQARTIGEE